MFSLWSERTPEGMGIRALLAIEKVWGADAVNLKRITSRMYKEAFCDEQIVSRRTALVFLFDTDGLTPSI